MIICVPSMRHSGTRLVKTSMLKDFIQIHPHQPQKIDPQRNYYVAGHVHRPSIDYLVDYMPHHLSIVPMRHPARIWKSYADRNMSYDYYFEHWMYLMDLYSKYPMAFIHIDSINRDYYLNEASKFIGYNLTTNWPDNDRTGDKGNSSIEVTDIMCAKVPSVIMDFYHSTL